MENNHLGPMYCEWTLIEKDKFGSIIDTKTIPNLITDNGRDLIFKCLFMLAASAGVVCMGVGASTTTATATDTRLTYELIGNPTRKPLVNTSGSALSPSDIVADPVTIGSVTYRRKITAVASWDSLDLNNGNQFGEFGLFTTDALPATPTSTSGIMFNHLIDPSPTLKGSGNSIEAQINVRF